MELWQRVFRDGVAPEVSDAGLEALATALEADDQRLLQGATTTPPPLACVQDWPVEGACPIGYAGWQGNELPTVAETEEYFGRVCYQADQRLGEPAAVRFFLNWWDDSPRADARQALLAEVRRELEARSAAQQPVRSAG